MIENVIVKQIINVLKFVVLLNAKTMITYATKTRVIKMIIFFNILVIRVKYNVLLKIAKINVNYKFSISLKNIIVNKNTTVKKFVI